MEVNRRLGNALRPHPGYIHVRGGQPVARRSRSWRRGPLHGRGGQPPWIFPDSGPYPSSPRWWRSALRTLGEGDMEWFLHGNGGQPMSPGARASDFPSPRLWRLFDMAEDFPKKVTCFISMEVIRRTNGCLLLKVYSLHGRGGCPLSCIQRRHLFFVFSTGVEVSRLEADSFAHRSPLHGRGGGPVGLDEKVDPPTLLHRRGGLGSFLAVQELQGLLHVEFIGLPGHGLLG